MKKILLMLSAVALFTACSDDGGSGSGNINYEEGYKYLTSLNVSDAKMIYQKSSSTRAIGDDSYYKLDLSGNEVKLSIKGDDGQDHNIGIGKVIKLSDKIILVNPVAQDIVDLFYKPGPDELGISVGYQSTEYLSIVDIQTEKLYRWPKEVAIDLYRNGELQTALDKQGNIYFAYSDYSQNQIYKLNVSDFTMQAMLPNGQKFTDFNVTGNGFIMYWIDNNYKVKCPGGRIYPITDIPFIINNELYSYKDEKIIKWETVDNNELKESEICKIEGDNEHPEVDIRGLIYNYARNSVLLQSNYGRYYYEFDGTTYQPIELPNSFHWYEGSNGNFQTSKAWYIQSNTRFYKMSMIDYQESEFRISDYEIQSVFASPKSPNITFNGIRYMDGANVVGTITESDEVVIDNVAENGNKIINLISLN